MRTSTVVGAVISEPGLKEDYFLPLLRICSGDLSDADPGKVSIEECTSYTDTSGGIALKPCVLLPRD
jgi:hypothetical protein